MGKIDKVIGLNSEITEERLPKIMNHKRLKFVEIL